MAFFEDLQVWQLARDLTMAIYKTPQYGHDYGFRDQMQRAAVSIMNNIAEGSESGSMSSYIHFLNIARGSCAEVRNMLYLCEPLGYCSQEQAKALIADCRHITALLNKLISYIQTRKQ